ncbi:MAG TPA: 50S ribosomal protein L25 [Acidimicrobiales bacterium]|nr:50S ribosomal protein L25 [Acidimicrobiales bacterium]
MAEVVLAAEVGRPVGTRAVRRLRREGKIPGVIYGRGADPLPVAVVARDLRVALNGEAGANQLLSLDTGSGSYLTLAREMQRHPVSQTVTHVDFVIVRRDEVIGADVPITLVGEATEVHHGDGLVDQQMFTLAINALPTDIPTAIEADVSGLTIGGQVRVSDLALPAGVTTDVDPESAVVVGQPPRVVVEAAPAEGEAAAEGEAEAPGARPSGEAAEAASEEG